MDYGIISCFYFFSSFLEKLEKLSSIQSASKSKFTDKLSWDELLTFDNNYFAC